MSRLASLLASAERAIDGFWNVVLSGLTGRELTPTWDRPCETCERDTPHRASDDGLACVRCASRGGFWSA